MDLDWPSLRNKNPADKWERKKISCPAGLQKKNFADQKSATQPHVRTALPSFPSTFHLFFTSHHSPLSERLEQATP